MLLPCCSQRKIRRWNDSETLLHWKKTAEHNFEYKSNSVTFVSIPLSCIRKVNREELNQMPTLFVYARYLKLRSHCFVFVKIRRGKRQCRENVQTDSFVKNATKSEVFGNAIKTGYSRKRRFLKKALDHCERTENELHKNGAM